MISPLLNEDDGFKIIICSRSNNPCAHGSAFGTNICMKGREYHWQIKVEIEDKCRYQDPELHVGTIEISKESQIDTTWWMIAYGYSYWTTF